MTWVQFRLGLPDGSWLADVSRAHPRASIRSLGTVIDEGTGYTLLSIATDEPEAVRTTVDCHETVEVAETVGSGGRELIVHLTGSPPRFVTAARNAGLPVEPPVVVENGVVSLEVVGTHDRLSALGRQFATLDVAFEVERVGRYDAAVQVLTDAQYALVLAAIEEGYYDTPRRCSLTELAETYGIAKSTCSETLQRAEERLMKRFVELIPATHTGNREGSGSEVVRDSDPEVVA